MVASVPRLFFRWLPQGERNSDAAVHREKPAHNALYPTCRTNAVSAISEKTIGDCGGRNQTRRAARRKNQALRRKAARRAAGSGGDEEQLAISARRSKRRATLCGGIDRTGAKPPRRVSRGRRSFRTHLRRRDETP